MSLVFCLVQVLGVVGITRAVPMHGQGTTCVFPFTFQNDMYFQCVPLIPDNSSLICATTGNFNKDAEWGICVPGELTSLHCQ